MIISSQRHLFALPDHICYLNAAYMTPQTHAMRQAGYDGINNRADAFSIRENHFFDDVETLRANFSELICAAPDDIAIINAASYGLAIAANNIDLNPGQHIVLLENQFPSNAYVWFEKAKRENLEITSAAIPKDCDITQSVLTTIEGLADKVGIVAIPAVHWSNGLTLDLKLISEVVRKLGAKLVLDITQSLGAIPFSVKDVRPDYMVASGYKWLFCPYGISFLYVAPEHQMGRPLEEGWINRYGSNDFSQLVAYEDMYQSGARRFDMGERASFGLIPQAIRSIEQILAWSPINISETLKNYNAKVAECFSDFGFHVLSQDYQSDHLLCLRSEFPIHAEFVDTMVKYNVFLSVRGSNIRIAPHLYNNENDLNILLSALKDTVN